jgi:hexosaminidase
MAKYLKSKGRRMIYWADELDQIPDEPSAILQFWKGNPDILFQAAQRGHDLINCDNGFTYLDYNYASLSLDKAYNFDPVPAGFDKKRVSQVLGLGAQAWGEYTPTQYRFELQVFPRLAALAEAAWTPLNKKDYTAFVPRLQTQQARWSLAGILYTPDAEIPLIKIKEAVMQGTKIGSWTSDQLKVPKSRYNADPDSYKEFDITPYINGAGRYRVAAIPTAGADEIHVRVAEILENGKAVACDWAGHSSLVAKFGSKKIDYIMDLAVDSVQPGAKYTLRLNYFGPKGTVSAGDFYIKKIGTPLPSLNP